MMYSARFRTPRARAVGIPRTISKQMALSSPISPVMHDVRFRSLNDMTAMASLSCARNIDFNENWQGTLMRKDTAYGKWLVTV